MSEQLNTGAPGVEDLKMENSIPMPPPAPEAVIAEPPAGNRRVDDLKLLVEWSSPWDEFRSALRPALKRSPRRLAGEAPVGIFPYRGMVGTWLGEALVVVVFIFLSRGFDTLRTYQTPAPAKYDVIYFSGAELPRTSDVGGAQSGRTGRAGGREAHHPTQVIRVARGESLRQKVVDAPKLNLPRSDTAVANLLAIQRVPGPPPMEGIRPSLRAPSPAQLAAIAPPPEVQRERMRDAPALGATVVEPAPTAGELATRLPGSNPVQVVPPPVSAPERDSVANSRLRLPAPSVVAPPPQVSQEIAKNGPGYGPGELQTQVVPPPVQLGNGGSEHRAVAGLGNSAVVPPPVQLGASTVARQSQNGLGGGTAVVPPPVQLGGGTTSRQSVNGLGGTAVVPPPPTLAAGGSSTGRGRGERGGGLGGPGDIGELAAPPNSGGNGKGAGIVLSDQPGSKVGVPGSGGAGSLAMSPEGGSSPGLGGYGGGTGISRGNGPGSGLAGEGTGAGHEGTGHGSDPSARGGISPFPGRGGAGSVPAGNPAAPGVAVSGGTTSNVINLPSFDQGGFDPADPSRSSATGDKAQGITVIATSRSGGGFNYYGAMKGDKVYTRYIDTALGPAVMLFSDPSTSVHPDLQELTSPQPMRVGLPAGLRRSRLVIACILDRTGALRNAQVLEAGEQVTTAKVLAALASWKFSPALRGNQPVEVNAILGFGIDTNDRF